MQLFKKPKVPHQPGPVLRDDVIGDIARQDALMRRRGGAADIVAGMTGEGPAGGKVTLGS
jgi:hypothetical protein